MCEAKMNRSRPARAVALAAALVAASACSGLEDLLDVELPGSMTEGDLVSDPAMVEIWLNSAVGRVECAFDAYLTFDDNSDVWWRGIGYQGGMAEYRLRPGTGETCGRTATSYSWYVPMQVARAESERVYNALSGYSTEQVPDRDRMMSIAATYAGYTYQLLGEVMCELAVDLGPLLTPADVQTKAETWFTTALDQIGTTGDFETLATESIEQMALLGRARARYAKDDWTGAAQDAAAVQPGFVAWILRDNSELERRNQSFNISSGIQATVARPVFHVFGQPGAVQIPFTGYYDFQAGVEDANGRPVVFPLAVDATDGRTHVAGFPLFAYEANTVADPRVPVAMSPRLIPGTAIPIVVQTKYNSFSSPIPLARWAEAQLILAEIEGGAQAVARINALRDVHGLPHYTVASPTAQDIEELIIEERRREFFLEGRFYGTKIKKSLWFPNGQGTVPTGYRYQNGTCMLMPENEYELNPNL